MSANMQQEQTSESPALIQWRYSHTPSSSDNGMSLLPKLRGSVGNPAGVTKGVLVALGVGGVGGVVTQAAARHMVGTVVMVDPDSYQAESWLTQPALPTDAGRHKAWVQGEIAHAIYPAGHVWAGVGFAQDLPLSVLRRASVLVVAGDNRALPVWAGQMGLNLKVPVVQGAVDGNTWTAIVRGYNLADTEATCPACTMSTKELAQLDSLDGCDPGKHRALGQVPTRTLPMVCGTAGQLAFAEAMKWMLGTTKLALAGEELTYCLLSHRLYRTELPRHLKCHCRHRSWNQADIEVPLAEVTLAMLADRWGQKLDPASGLQVRSEVPWISFVLCPGCGRQNTVRRFARLMEPVSRCNCGEVLVASPLGKHSVLPADDLRACWEVPLASLGLGPGAAVGMSMEEDWTYFFAAGWPLAACGLAMGR